MAWPASARALSLGRKARKSKRQTSLLRRSDTFLTPFALCGCKHLAGRPDLPLPSFPVRTAHAMRTDVRSKEGQIVRHTFIALSVVAMGLMSVGGNPRSA